MKNKTSIFKTCGNLLGNNKKSMTMLCIYGAISVIFEMGIILFSAFYGINKALASRDFNLILISAAVILIFGLASKIFFHIQYRLSLKFNEKESNELRKRVFEKAIYLDANYYANNSTGAMINTIMYDVETFSDGMSNSVLNVLKLFVKALLSFVVVTILKPSLSIILWLTLIVVVIFSYLVIKKLGKLYSKRRAVNKKRLSHINEGIMGLKTVKSLGIEEKETETFKKYNKEHYGINMKIAAVNEIFWRFYDIVTYGALAVLFVTSTKISMSYGELFLYFQLFKNTLYVTAHLALEFDGLSEIMVSASKVQNLLDYEPLVKDKEIIQPKADNLSGNIKFENVTFTYPSGETVLKDFNLDIKKNTMVAIVGQTGAGKSTIANLIYRFYEPSLGKILFDDTNYKDLSIDYIHRQIGFILQTPMLFDDTIENNLRYAKPDATLEEIEAAVKFVGADDFIKKLKDGYQTKIGESGILLSNGQQQLISLARVFLKNPNIIIFDEATASIDSKTEEYIQNNLSRLMNGKTCIFIAHRLSTIVDADKIIYLENGKISEQGTHKQLMKLNKKYAKLYNKQRSGLCDKLS